MQPMTFEIKIKVKDMYAYLMYHAYKGIGIFNIILSVIAIIMLIQGGSSQDSTRFMILLFIALFFTVIQPVTLYLKAAQQIMGNPLFQKPIKYTFNEEEFITSQEKESMSVTYDKIWKIKVLSKRIFIYTGRFNASIIPLMEIPKEEKDKLITFLKEKEIQAKTKKGNDNQIAE